MNLPKVEEKQQYIEVYAPGEKWVGFSDWKKKEYLAKLEKEIEQILYGS